MGRRYYCDYCDKKFIDDIEHRKKHLQSSYHIKLRNLHYEYCKDPETLLREELLKTPCRRFSQYGSCQFERSCKYTHYSPEELCELRQQVERIQIMRRKKLEEVPNVPSVESWMQKYNKSNNKEDDEVVHTFWTYPESFERRLDLPPSLVRFKPEHFSDDNFEEWGK
ncbi:zinc finger matrin-type protein 5 [Anoplophora glabripennis]|uniref:zinc finger matrin-type protein 5 n=1 Tax=Anoplophora glabripennis TaxID=217634 RepID=UPI000873E416|nr:zinc finger matrin-type protein 5 [Anoplophora glabripennis]